MANQKWEIKFYFISSLNTNSDFVGKKETSLKFKKKFKKLKTNLISTFKILDYSCKIINIPECSLMSISIVIE